MRRVLHIIGGLSTGGAEMMLFKLLASRSAGDLHHSIVTLKDGGALAARIESLDVAVRSAGMTSALSLPTAIQRVLRFMREEKADIVQGWMYHGNTVARLASDMLSPKPRVFWSIRHCIYDLRDEKRTTAHLIRLGAKLSSRIEKIIYNSAVSASQHEAIGYSSESRLVIPNGFDCDHFGSSSDTRTSIRRTLNLGDDTMLIGMVARYHPMKDHGNLMRAACILAESVPNVHFVLAGANVDVYNEELTTRLAEYGLSKHFHLLGERDDVADILQALDIATLSSSSEAFPNVIGEAMACRIPVVATDVGETANLVADTGIVVPPRDAAALAAAWKDLLLQNPAGRSELGRRARDRICRDFDIERIAARYQDLYRA